MYGDSVHSISMKWEIITNIELFNVRILTLMKNDQT